MSQGKKTPDEIRRRVRELLFEDENLIGKELKDKVEKERPFAKLDITERTYQSIKKQELPRVKILKASIPENTWSIGALRNTNEITPDAVPYIMEMQRWVSTQKESIIERPFLSVTVRQAKWISRLLPIFFKMFIRGKKLTNVGLGWLWRWSKVYSINERKYEMEGEKGAFDTTELDAALLRGDRIDVFGDTYVRFSGDKITEDSSKSITIVTSDEDIRKRSVKENIVEENVYNLKELPKFKNVMKARRKNE